MTSLTMPDLWAALDGIQDRQEAKYAATCEAVRSYLRSLSVERGRGLMHNGHVTSDDACMWLDQHGIKADKRLLGAVFRKGFTKAGYASSTRRRGMHAVWMAL